MTTSTRHGGFAAALAFSVATSWIAVLAHILGRWPGSVRGVIVVALFAAGAAAIALVVSRWWPRQRDIRVAISDRVLVAALTAATVATAFAGVVLALDGRPPPESADTMRACLVAAVVTGIVLGPCRRRFLALSHRVVYGSAGPRRQLLDQFARRLGRASSLDDVLAQLVETVRPACAADGAEVWLYRDVHLVLTNSLPRLRAEPIPIDAARAAAFVRAGVSGGGWTASWLPELRHGDDHVRVAPLAMQGDLLGALVVRRPAPADDFDDADDEGLARVVRIVAATLQNAELDAELRRTVDELRRSNDELRRSRSRIVTVADDERRRLERDLHDGAQSHLMGIAVKLQLARALVGDDPDAATAVIEEVESDLGTANAQLRSLAHGIFPPLLLTGGLRDALAGVAAHATARVAIGHVTTERYDPQVEAAIYFCCCEAVQNAAKHAGADAGVTIDVVAESATGALVLTVRDDGPGFDPATTATGHGLVNMADRLGALGGTLTVTGDGGTTVTGSVPATALQRDSSVR